MNRDQRERFLKRVEAKYSYAQGIIDPWANKPESTPKVVNWRVISELEILQVISSVRGIMMFPKTYKVEYPQESTVIDPWAAPTVTFSYVTSRPDQNLVNQVETALKNKFGDLIHVLETNDDGTNSDGNGVYTVTIYQDKSKS